MDSSESTSSSGPSALAGLPSFWDHHETPPQTEWEKWWDIFIVAVNAKHSISDHELLRTPTQSQPRQAALLNNINELAAERKIVSILFLSLVTAARKNLTDKYPNMTVATASLNEIKINCEETFQRPRNRTLDRFKFFSRKQQPNESLRQFWNALTGLAARCEFDQQTEGLIMDAFIQNMHNKTVQERLCTDSKKSTAGSVTIRCYLWRRNCTTTKLHGWQYNKKETVYAIDGRGKNPCTRCGLEFNQNHLSVCKAKGEKCRNCGVIGHFMRMCKRPKVANFGGNAKFANRGGIRRVNPIGQTADKSEDSSEVDEDLKKGCS